MKKFLKSFLLVFVFLVSYIFLYRIYSLKTNSFGCFDDCFNYLGGYFMLKGKTLYSEIFFNHQRLMADISFLIQKIFQPENIYELVLRHRQFVFIFGFLINFIIVVRFKVAGLFFVLFYEFSKFYLFGDRFLAESLIVYPLVYLTGLVWYKFQKEMIYLVEYLLSAVFVWFIIFSREPFVPLALFLFLFLLLNKEQKKVKFLSILLFLSLFSITLFFTPLKDYLENVFVINNLSIFSAEVKSNQLFGRGLLYIFFYPFLFIFNTKWNIFWQLFAGIDIVFILAFIYLFILKKKKLLFLVLFILTLANLRPVSPGTIFYGAFHQIPYFALFIFLSMLMFFSIWKNISMVGSIRILIIFTAFILYILNPKTFIHEKDNRHEELITNYGNYLETGEILKTLSGSGDTLFLEEYDYLVYWQSGLASSYKYSLFIPIASGSPKYLQAKKEMYTQYPPTFYYGPENPKLSQIPIFAKNSYTQLLKNKKLSHIYINNKIINKIPQSKWEKAKSWGYELPKK